jgi:tRNA pseudouridine38-40 synthase
VLTSLQQARQNFRLTTEDLHDLRFLFKKYEGPKLFHNFTSGKEAGDPSTRRFIMSFQVGEPQVIDHMEWINLKVQGQSFMFHQIRKMIGEICAILLRLSWYYIRVPVFFNLFVVVFFL